MHFIGCERHTWTEVVYEKKKKKEERKLEWRNKGSENCRVMCLTQQFSYTTSKKDDIKNFR